MPPFVGIYKQTHGIRSPWGTQQEGGADFKDAFVQKIIHNLDNPVERCMLVLFSVQGKQYYLVWDCTELWDVVQQFITSPGGRGETHKTQDIQGTYKVQELH